MLVMWARPRGIGPWGLPGGAIPCSPCGAPEAPAGGMTSIPSSGSAKVGICIAVGWIGGGLGRKLLDRAPRRPGGPGGLMGGPCTRPDLEKGSNVHAG